MGLKCISAELNANFVVFFFMLLYFICRCSLILIQIVTKLFRLLIFSIFILKSMHLFSCCFFISIFTFHPIYWHRLQIWQKTDHCWCRISINIFFWLNHSISSMSWPCWVLSFLFCFFVLNELYIRVIYNSFNTKKKIQLI